MVRGNYPGQIQLLIPGLLRVAFHYVKPFDFMTEFLRNGHRFLVIIRRQQKDFTILVAD